MNPTSNHPDEGQDEARAAAALPVPAELDQNALYVQWSLMECQLCGERSEVAEHAEHGTWEIDHGRRDHPEVRMLPTWLWTISRARARTYYGPARPTTGEEEAK